MGNKRGYCKDCHWFDQDHASLEHVKLIVGKYSVGYCRKHKPVVFLMEQQYWGGWPMVDELDLCGEFRSKIIGD
jgi:hypothetical protein